MTVTELINCPDHTIWAAEFCRIARDKGFDPANAEHQDWLAGWFANAMMNGYDRAARMTSAENEKG